MSCHSRLAMNVAIRRSWLWRRFLVGVVAVSAVLLAASSAEGDIGVVGVHPKVSAPGQPVEVETACGGRCGTQLPISLVPVARAPNPQPCITRGVKSLCSPEVAEPPRQPPYVFLGWARQDSRSSAVTRYRLRFRVPRVAPGPYAFVACNGCAQGHRGTLVVNTTQPGNLLQVRSEPNSVASQGPGSDAQWLIAAAAGVAVIAGAGVLLRRRRAQ
jgi:LPXTG-motif cell wall-anchored protein